MLLFVYYKRSVFKESKVYSKHHKAKSYVLEKKIEINDKQALQYVFEKYYKSLVLFANGFVPVISACEDMVQDVFIAIWKNQAKFPSENALLSYLYKTVKNKCLNHIKHEKVKTNHSKDIMILLEDAHVVEQKTIEIETVRMLHQAIEQLPDRRKEVILKSLKGFRNDVIAARMNIEVQTVKTLKSQAYQQLRNYFKQMND